MSWALVCKVFQKRSFDLLSHRTGVAFILFLVTLSVVAAFHFGEVVILWASNQYLKVFDRFQDNIGGCSYQSRVCSKLPIDVVYTWVNGSDPILIEELKSLRKKMAHSWNVSDESQNRSQCTLADCIPANGIVIQPPLLLGEDSEDMFSFAKTKPNIFLVSDSGKEATCILFQQKDDLPKALLLNLTSFNKRKISRLYYTSDSSSVNVYKKEGLILSLGLPGTLKDGDHKTFLTKFGDEFISDFSIDVNSGISSFYVFNKTTQNRLLSETNFTLLGKSVKFRQGFLVWDLDTLSARSEISSNRFRDTDELKFSLRSLEKFAPWVRQVFIVTNGQVPSWLVLDNPRLKVITHEDIFTNKSNLPTFSSPAIESHLHRIHGLSDHFIYLNDDVLFGQPVWPDDFISEDGVHNIYLTYPVPDCKSGCPGSWIRDGYCDKNCNCSECDWDGGDCDFNSTVARRTENRFSGVLHDQQGQFPWSSSLQAQHCSPGCADNWIADRYCDVSCNIYKCGFDAGDCGTTDFDKVQKVPLSPDMNEYSYFGYSVLHFDLSNLAGPHGFVSDGEFDDSPVVRSFSFMNSSKLLTLVLKSNHSKTSIDISLEITKEDLDKFIYNFTLFVDTTLEVVPGMNDQAFNNSSTFLKVSSTLKPERTQPTILNPIPYPKKSLKINMNTSMNLVNRSLPVELKGKLKNAADNLDLNYLTQRGFIAEEETILKEHFKKINMEWSNQTIKKFLMQFPLKAVQEGVQLGGVMSKALSGLDEKLSRKGLNITGPWNSIVQMVRRGLKSKFDNSTGKANVSNTYPKYPDRGFLPWEKKKVFDKIQEENEKVDSITEAYTTGNRFGRKLMDAFEDSIHHVNRIYNRAYGYFARKLPAHSAHYFDKQILAEMQQKFSEEWEQTSSHKIRSSQDMQLAFSYFYFLMSERKNSTIEEIFNEFDIDGSGVLSDRELRILATRIYSLPLFIKELVDLESNLINCSSDYQSEDLSTTKPEKYFEKRLPQVTLHFVSNCPEISEILLKSFSNRERFRHKTILNSDDFVAFKMIRNNSTTVVRQLDEIRKYPKKFICLNDDLDDDADPVGVENVRALIRDFYYALFPMPSQFELRPSYRNKFLYIRDYNEFTRFTNNTRKFILVIIFVCCCLVCLKLKFKPKLARRRLQIL